MQIHPDIRHASTLPAAFYRHADSYQRCLERLFLPSWQWIGSARSLDEHALIPFSLLDGSLSEPLLLSKDKSGEIHCLSNVCTHRGKILVEQPTNAPLIACGYHGRCFQLNGKFRSMPEFKEAADFPSDADHLPALTIERLGVFLFTSLAPEIPFAVVFRPILERMTWFPFDQLIEHAASHQCYEVKANWALYCDNYLEGFHVPFVHPALGARLDYAEYSTEIFEHCNLQLGVASDDAAYFELPPNSPDYGKKIHAYYWWVFPNLMLNIYTWGISVNIVEPLGIDRTRIVFKTYLLPGKTEQDFSGQVIHQTELEDEAVVESVQRGVQSRLYRQGRFSPKREQCVHHFHRLVADRLK